MKRVIVAVAIVSMCTLDHPGVIQAGGKSFSLGKGSSGSRPFNSNNSGFGRNNSGRNNGGWSNNGGRWNNNGGWNNGGWNNGGWTQPTYPVDNNVYGNQPYYPNTYDNGSGGVTQPNAIPQATPTVSNLNVYPLGGSQQTVMKPIQKFPLGNSSGGGLNLLPNGASSGGGGGSTLGTSGKPTGVAGSVSGGGGNPSGGPGKPGAGGGSKNTVKVVFKMVGGRLVRLAQFDDGAWAVWNPDNADNPQGPDYQPPAGEDPSASITLLNPTETRGTVNFNLASQNSSLESGYAAEAAAPAPQLIVFDRGGSFGEARYTLQPGSAYRFATTAQGWDIRAVTQLQ